MCTVDELKLQQIEQDAILFTPSLATLRLYSMDADAFAALYKKQHGVCAACLKPFGTSWLDACNIHHDHKCCPGRKSCGKCVVALLHPVCNLFEGVCHSSPIEAYNMVANVNPQPYIIEWAA
jgi:hypothetical protein